MTGCAEEVRGGRKRRAQPRTRYVTLSGVTVSVAEWPGSGPPLVLLHGLTASWQATAALAHELSDRWHVCALDLRGHGASSRTPGAYAAADFAADVARFVDDELSTPVSIYGHSLGGWIALIVAAHQPRLVRSVVVADSVLFPDGATPHQEDLPRAAIVGRSLSPALRRLDPGVLAAFRQGRLTGGYDPESLLPRVRCPTVLLQGDPTAGAYMTDVDVERGLRLLRNGWHIRLPDVGHAVQIAAPGRVAAAVRPFLWSAAAPAESPPGLRPGPIPPGEPALAPLRLLARYTASTTAIQECT